MLSHSHSQNFTEIPARKPPNNFTTVLKVKVTDCGSLLWPSDFLHRERRYDNYPEVKSHSEISFIFTPGQRKDLNQN